MEDSDWNILVLKKNLRSWNNSVIISVEDNWKAENKPVSELQVIGDGFVVTLFHEAREGREATYNQQAGHEAGKVRLYHYIFFPIMPIIFLLKSTSKMKLNVTKRRSLDEHLHILSNDNAPCIRSSTSHNCLSSSSTAKLQAVMASFFSWLSVIIVLISFPPWGIASDAIWSEDVLNALEDVEIYKKNHGS